MNLKWELKEGIITKNYEEAIRQDESQMRIESITFFANTLGFISSMNLKWELKVRFSPNKTVEKNDESQMRIERWICLL